MWVSSLGILALCAGQWDGMGHLGSVEMQVVCILLHKLTTLQGTKHFDLS